MELHEKKKEKLQTICLSWDNSNMTPPNRNKGSVDSFYFLCPRQSLWLGANWSESIASLKKKKERRMFHMIDPEIEQGGHESPDPTDPPTPATLG